MALPLLWLWLAVSIVLGDPIMTVNSSSISALVCAIAWLSAPATSFAQSREDRVLVVGVAKGKSVDLRLTKALSEHLERTGSVAVIPNELTTSERLCTDQDCLEVIARRSDAQIVLSAVLQQNAPGSFYITLGLFDVTRRAPFQDSVLCEHCGPAELLAKLSDATDRLIAKCREGRQEKPTPTATPALGLSSPLLPVESVPSVAEPAPATRLIPTIPMDAGAASGSESAAVSGSAIPAVPLTPSRATEVGGLSRDRKILLGILGGVAVVALGTAIGLHVKDRSLEPSSSCKLIPGSSIDACVQDNRTLYVTGYSVAAASAIGLGITLFWPRSGRAESSAAAPTVSLSLPVSQPPNALGVEVRP